MSRNPLIAAVIAGLAVLLFWVLVLGPRGAEVERLQGEILAAEGELSSMNAQLAALRSVDLPALQAELANYRNKIPVTPDESGIIESILGAARVAGVSVDGIQFGAPGASGAAPVSLIGLSFTARGQYFDLSRFLFELENLDRLSYVRSISISPAEGGLSMAVAVDLYTSDLSAGPGSDPAPGPEVGA